MKPLLMLFFISSFSTLHAQEEGECKVLVPALNGVYQGGCKNGLANGKGQASGTDAYEGGFRNGYPNGKGTYTWATGNTYKGEWLKGMREGEGVFSGKFQGRDTIMAGIWKNDIFMGPKPTPPKVTTKYNVTSTSFVRNGDGSKISVSFYQNGITNLVESLDFTCSSGNEIRSGNITTIWDIRFPFNCKVNYRSWNSLKTQQYDCILEFEITQPGSWDLHVGN
jgi:hypothetical protein